MPRSNRELLIQFVARSRSGILRSVIVATNSASRTCRRAFQRSWRPLLMGWLAVGMIVTPEMLTLAPQAVFATDEGSSGEPPEEPEPDDPKCYPEEQPECEDCPPNGGGGGESDPDDDDDGDGEPEEEDPIKTCDPVVLRHGTASESVTDLYLPTPAFDWGFRRTYNSSATGSSAIGTGWKASTSDSKLIQDGTNVKLILSANGMVLFTGTGSPVVYTAPDDFNLELEHDSGNSQFIVTSRRTKERLVFHDFTVSPTAKQGKLIEESTLQWDFQGKTGFEYSYNASGLVNNITTPDGQAYSIAFTYAGSSITKIEIKDGSTVLQRAEYTYYEDVTSPSSDIGSAGNLVQVKISRRATKDAGSTLSIVRYTHYRYHADGKLKAVYSHDALQRIISALDVTDEADFMTKADDFGNPDVELFANRRFTYYSADTSTSSINTPFTTGENLNTTYGGSEAAENGFVKTETVLTGCGACSTTGGITRSYFYLDLDQGATLDQNEVVRIVIEDLEDTDGNAHVRTVYGLNDGGRRLRTAFIDDPTGTPAYWCESWKMTTSGKKHRLGEYRLPSAHDVGTASELRDFLDPYDSEGNSWTKDTNTLYSSDGAIYVLAYNSAGMRTETKVKKGNTGTAYFVSAIDYGDADGDSAGNDNAFNTRVIARYDYPTQTTTKTDGKKTSYSFTFWDTDDRLAKTKTTTLPIIPTSQNGSGVATTIVRHYDKSGRVRWKEDGEGYIKYYAHDPVTGGRAYEAMDIDPDSVSSEISSGSSGNWEAWTVGDANNNKPSRSMGLPTTLNLVEKTYYDAQGYARQLITPAGRKHFAAYADDETIIFPYWNGTNKTLLPTRVTKLYHGTKTAEEYEVKASFTSFSKDGSDPTGFSTAPIQSDYTAWTRYTYDDTTGSKQYTDDYHDIPSSGTGTLSTNFYRTVMQPDTLGRPEYTIQVVSGSAATNRKEQVTQRVYDIRGRITKIKQGVSGDSAANSHNMTDDYDAYPTLYTLAEAVYDDNSIGDGHATQIRRYHDTGTNDYTGTNYHRTYAGDIRGIEPFYMSGSTETPKSPFMVLDVNWRGQTTARGAYVSAPTWATVLTGDGYTDYASSTATNRRALRENEFDDLARLFRTDDYTINQSTGALSSSLRMDVFYDRRGNVVAVGDLTGGTTSEYAYDGAGRQYQSRTVLEIESTKYTSGAFNYRAPVPNPEFSSDDTTAVSGGDDKVVSFVHQVLNSANRVTEQHTFDMNHDDGTLGVDLSANDDYVRQSVFAWYDDADRVTTLADYGSGDTTAGTGEWKYATVPNPSSAPTASSETALIKLYAYHADTSRLDTITDPAGIDSKTFYDDLGRETWIAENYDNFDPDTLTTISDGTDSSKDRVTKTEYAGFGLATKLIAYNGSSTADQQTLYLFEDAVNASRLTNTIYPDSSDTTSSGSNQVELDYNLDGSLSERTDQRGTVIAFAYDVLRRSQSQKVTTLGGSTDGTVRAITRGYDSLGRLEKLTSHGNQTDDPDNTTDIENQIVYSYNGRHQITKSEQSHDGAVSGSTPNIRYAYDDSDVSGVYNDGMRPFHIIYPDGRTLFYDYGTSNGLEDRQQWAKQLRETDSSGTLWAEYSHTGTGHEMVTDYPQSDLKQDLFGGTSGTYAALDRFGRTIDHRWYDYSSGTIDRARYSYGYDEASNRIWKEDPVADANSVDLDDLSTFDGLHRLTAIDRGELNGTRTAISTLEFAQDFDLDQLNNWEGFTEDSDGNGTDDLDQDRSHNDANEITDIDASATHVAHDAAGNMTKVPQPNNWSAHYDLTWDAWNRLIQVKDGANTVAEYEYDGWHRRIRKGVYASGTLDHTRHYYLSTDWQVLEERVDTSTVPDRQYTWGERYIDDLLLRTRDTTGNGVLNETIYPLQDANWNITALADINGAIVERFAYDPYGHSTVLDENFSNDSNGFSDFDWEYRHTSREFDAESGLHHFRTRYYHDRIGRFLGRDSLRYINGLSLYAAYFAPNQLDPWGLDSINDIADLAEGYTKNHKRRKEQKAKDQARLEELHCIMRGIIDAIDKYPKIPGPFKPHPGRTGFPYNKNTFPVLRNMMEYSIESYPNIGGFNGIVVGGNLPGGTANNAWWFPGFAIDRDLFEGREDDAIATLTHEPQHDFNQTGAGNHDDEGRHIGGFEKHNTNLEDEISDLLGWLDTLVDPNDLSSSLLDKIKDDCKK